MKLRQLWLRFWGRFGPRRIVRYCEGDEVPSEIVGRDLVVAREGEMLWEAALSCPCGCGQRIELQLLPEAKPHWRLSFSNTGHPTLQPSVFRNSGCRAHFWLRNGRILWVF